MRNEEGPPASSYEEDSQILSNAERDNSALPLDFSDLDDLTSGAKEDESAALGAPHPKDLDPVDLSLDLDSGPEDDDELDSMLSGANEATEPTDNVNPEPLSDSTESISDDAVHEIPDDGESAHSSPDSEHVAHDDNTPAGEEGKQAESGEEDASANKSNRSPPTAWLLLTAIGAMAAFPLKKAWSMIEPSRANTASPSDAVASAEIAAEWKGEKVADSLKAVDDTRSMYSDSLKRLQDTDWFNKSILLNDAIKSGDVAEVNRLTPLVAQAADTETAKSAMLDFQHYSNEMLEKTKGAALEIEASPDPSAYEESFNNKMSELSKRAEEDSTILAKLSDGNIKDSLKDVLSGLGQGLAAMIGRGKVQSPSM